MTTNYKGLRLKDGVHWFEDAEARKRLDEIKSTEVSTTPPSSENVQVWINPEESDNFSVPEIKDDTTNSVDTWSSKKISNELTLLSKKIEELQTKVQIASDDEVITYLGGSE